ncbi:MAG: DsbA family protein [Gemmatimonadaceae bacterium]
MTTLTFVARALVVAALVGAEPLSAQRAPNAPPPQQSSGAAPQSGISIDELGHDMGSRDAPNWIAEFLDMGCGYCARFATETFPSLDKEYVANGKIRWKFVPFVTGLFPHSEDAAVAAECAAQQGKFLEMHDSLLVARKEWIQGSKPQAVFSRLAKRLKLDQAAFDGCSRGNEARLRIKKQTMVAQQVSIRGTPTFFINGRRIEGAIPLPLFRQVLAETTH